jgi:hypothetical protein
MLVPSEVLDAVLPTAGARPDPANPVDYVTACLGAEAAAALPPDVIAAANQAIAHAHAATQHMAVSTPVLAPLDMAHCCPAITQALLQQQRFTAGFGLQFQYNYSGAYCQDSRAAVAAAAAGTAAYNSSTLEQGVTRGLTPLRQQLIVDAVTATLRQGLGVDVKATLAVGFVPAHGNGHWSCNNTCGCGSGVPHPGCFCDCGDCSRARQLLCPCAPANAAAEAAAKATGMPPVYVCPPGLPLHLQLLQLPQGQGAAAAGRCRAASSS